MLPERRTSMGRHRRVCGAALLVLGLCLGGPVVAQAQDPSQYPSLFNSRPFQRWWWSFQQRAYPLSDIPVDAKTHALQQIQQFKARQAPTAPAGVVPGDSWTNIGPAPVAGFFTASAGRRAVSSPMPLAPPVIKATLPLSLGMPLQ